MAITTDYQYSWNGGLTFGAGTVYPILSVDGISGLPDLRTQDDNRGYIDGMYSGRDFYGARVITFEMNTLASAGVSASENYSALKFALSPQQSGQPADLSTLEFKLPGSDSYIIKGRVRSNLTLTDPDYTYGLIRSSLSIYCPDPRYYSEVLFSETGTDFYIDNTLGSAVTCPVVTIANPGTTFYIKVTETLTGNVQTMNFDTTGITGSVIVIDLLQRTIAIDLLPARNILVGNSVWIECAAKSNSHFESDVSVALDYRVAYV